MENVTSEKLGLMLLEKARNEESMKIAIGEIILNQALVRCEKGKYSHRYQKENKRTTALQDGMDKWKLTDRLMKEYRKW